jgi:hypothetical protein
MKPYSLMLLSGVLLGLPWSALDAADDAEAKAVAYVEKIGGKVVIRPKGNQLEVWTWPSAT